MAESVEPHAVYAGPLGGRKQVAAAQAALVGWPAVAPGKHECVIGDSDATVSVERGGEHWGERDQAGTVARLRRDFGALVDREPHPQVRLLARQR